MKISRADRPQHLNAGNAVAVQFAGLVYDDGLSSRALPRPAFPLKALAIRMRQPKQGQMNGLGIPDMVQRRVDNDVDRASLRLLHRLGDQGDGIQKMADAS